MAWLKDSIDQARHDYLIGRDPIGDERVVTMSDSELVHFAADPDAYCQDHGWGRYVSSSYLAVMDYGVDLLVRTMP